MREDKESSWCWLRKGKWASSAMGKIANLQQILHRCKSESSSSTEVAKRSEYWKEEMKVKLFHVASRGDVEGAEALIEKGIEMNAVDYNGRSALHIAAQRGHLSMIQYLLSKGADVNSLDVTGETAWTLARNHFEIRKVLESAGAQVEDPRHPTALSRKNSNRKQANFAVMEAFPHRIASALLDGRQIETVSKPCVSLLFSDIVGFTTMSATMDPSKVTGLLRRLFHKLDRLAYVHGVQKIDVVGDAYIAAANFSEDQPDDHAARIARFAIDAMKAARSTPIDPADPLSPRVRLRIGLHCGAVHGGVIGAQGLKFTLLGDAVNVASRMESTSLPGRIQCSAAMATAVADQGSGLALRRRSGGADIKGKGPMTTFWVSPLRQSLGRSASCPDLLALAAAAAAAAAAQPAHGAPAALASTIRRVRSWPAVPAGGGCDDDAQPRPARAPTAAGAAATAAEDAQPSPPSPPSPPEARGRPRGDWWLSSRSQILRL